MDSYIPRGRILVCSLVLGEVIECFIPQADSDDCYEFYPITNPYKGTTEYVRNMMIACGMCEPHSTVSNHTECDADDDDKRVIDPTGL